MKGIKTLGGAALAVIAIAGLAGCDRSLKYDTNLLQNGSFEEIGGDGLPKHWKLVVFRGGAPNAPEATWGTDTLAVDGRKSFFFKADPGTRRFFMLQQEVKVVGATNVRVRGWILADGARMRADQSAQCNFLVTYYDRNHHRFQLERQADRRTPLRGGTHPWEEQVFTFDVPEGTHYIAMSAVLGMNGQAWFDHLSLEIPKPVPWETQTTKNYVFHWLPGSPMPQGAPEQQQARFDHFADRLGLKSDVVINYYFYPDTLTIQKMLGIKGIMYTSWDEYEFHTVMTTDDHELVHFMTDSIGRPPRSIAEGTVFWLQDSWGAVPLDDQIRKVVRERNVTKLTDLFEYDHFMHVDPEYSMTTATAFVKYVTIRFGNEKLIELYRALNGMNAYLPIAGAFHSVCGVTLEQFETEFHQWLIANYQ
jgi:hypothetical protein